MIINSIVHYYSLIHCDEGLTLEKKNRAKKLTAMDSSFSLVRPHLLPVLC